MRGIMTSKACSTQSIVAQGTARERLRSEPVEDRAHVLGVAQAGDRERAPASVLDRSANMVALGAVQDEEPVVERASVTDLERGVLSIEGVDVSLREAGAMQGPDRDVHAVALLRQHVERPDIYRSRQLA